MLIIKKIIAATKNEGKLAEIKEILRSLDIEILSLKDFRDIKDIKEDAYTFHENSLIKAKTVYEITKIPALADDSGLCVEYLDGMPGVFSARFSGKNADDVKNNDKLLALMNGVPLDKRRAYFKCAAVLVYGKSKVIAADGKMHGYIAQSPKGENGFGYDPVFYLPRYKMTTAELAPDKKNKISHRYKALKEIKSILRKGVK